MATKLTDVAARGAKPKEKPYKLAAGGGLYLEVMPNGAKYWRMKYRFAGREKRLAIGIYPDVPLRKASLERDTAKSLLRDGKDPSGEKRSAKLRAKVATENSLEVVSREWLEARGPNWTVGQLDSWAVYEGRGSA